MLSLHNLHVSILSSRTVRLSSLPRGMRMSKRKGLRKELLLEFFKCDVRLKSVAPVEKNIHLTTSHLSGQQLDRLKSIFGKLTR